MTDNESRMYELAADVMELSRNTLFLHMRFLDLALGQFKLIPADCGAIMTDGEHIVYDPRFVLKRYKKAQAIPTRDYLHIVMHCIFKHMYMGPEIHRQYWNLACDIAVENIIGELGIPAFYTDNERKQEEYLREIRQKMKTVTAERMYAYIRSGALGPDTIQMLAELFRADDHMLWYMDSQQAKEIMGDTGDNKGGRAGKENHEGETADPDASGDEYNQKGTDQDSRRSQAQTWQTIAERMQVDLETVSRRQGTEKGSLMQNLKEVTREQYDYAAFLKKFAVLGEIMKINDDEFDYIFYTYGLKLYEKMPLIEPLEYKEVKRIREFAIAIDTSGSTSGELVQTFLQKTYNILSDSESFFSKINVHIIQCDADIQEDAVITNQKEFDRYLQTMKIRGIGGTDFRPVFRYVDELIARKEFVNLKGLIYFTDGMGTFPERKPNYQTAFVFVGDEMNADVQLPPWAIKLVLRKNEI